MIPGRRAWLWAVASWSLLFLITRGAAWASGTFLEPDSIVVPPGYSLPETSGPGSVLVGSWLRADGLWYLKIADQGYGDFGTYAFFPLLPMLARVLSPLVGGVHIATLVIANLACLAGLAALYSFVEKLFDSRSAQASVLGLALFPTAFFLTAPYAEPLLLLFGSSALLAASNRRFVAASILGALAALCRPFGFLICIPMAALLKRDLRKGWPSVLAPILATAGWGLWVGVDSGDLLSILKVQSIWQREPEWPWVTAGSAFRQLTAVIGSALGPYYLLDVGLLILGIALVVGVLVASRADRLPPTAKSCAIYGCAVLLVPLAAPFPPRALLSMPRFVLALFPLFGAYRLIPRAVLITLLFVSTCVLAWATAHFIAARPIF